MRLGNRKFSIAGLIVLLGTIALLATACGGTPSGPSGDKAKDQTLKMGWATGGGPDITGLDPAQCSDTSCGPIVAMLFDGLVTLDKDLNVKPWAAKSINTSSDGLTYTFTLQPNMKFSDGNPVKPSDFAWSIDRSANPCLGSQLSYYLATIKDASTFSGETCANGQPQGSITTLVGDSVIPDDSANTLTIKLAQPAAYFLAALTYSTSFAVEKSAVTGDDLGKDDAWMDNLAKGATGSGTSGMFYVSKWDHQGVLTLKPNPNWWGTKPNFSEVDFKLFSSIDTEYSTYQTDNTLAYTDNIPPDQIAAAKSQPDYHQQPTLIIGGFMMNWKIAPFDDVNARKAFCLAVNRDQLNQSIAKGTQIPTWHVVPKGMPGYNENLKGIDGAPTSGDTTKAKAYWQQYLAAHGNKVPPIKLSFNLSSNTAKLSAEAYQATWNQTFGINTTIDQTAWKTILSEEQAKTLQLYRFGWAADYPDPQDWLTLLFSSDSPYNEQNASIPQADALMKQADGLADMNQRLPLYNQAEQMIVDQVAWCPTSQYQNYYRLRTWVKGGFVQTAQGSFPLFAWQTGYIANH
ncbi:MAG: peptide ABC transporter substrate-binding protein [Nitrososphaerota archaeon]